MVMYDWLTLEGHAEEVAGLCNGGAGILARTGDFSNPFGGSKRQLVPGAGRVADLCFIFDENLGNFVEREQHPHLHEL